MLKNKKFAFYTIAFCILGILFNFMYSGLQNDQINIIQSFSGWSSSETMLPLTAGSLLCIAATLIYGTLFIRYGVKRTLIPCIIISAIGCIGIALANGLTVYNGEGNYALYFVSILLIRVTCMCFQMSSMQLAASWFIKYRGRVLGIVTLGSPLFSVVGTSMMTSFIATNLGGDYRPFYVGIAVILVLMAVCTGLFIRNTPESVGLYPDGANTAPKSEAIEEVRLSIGQVLKQKKAWQLIISFGIFQYIIVCAMASMTTWFMQLAADNADLVAQFAASSESLAATYAGLEAGGQTTMFLFVAQAAKWLSVGAILGIPMSYVFGMLDDKIGSVKASIVLGITELLPVLGLLMQSYSVRNTGSCSVIWLVIWGFGVACMTGGVPTLHPCITAYCYGRREYQSANRIIMAIQLIPGSFGALVTTNMITSGNGEAAWIGLLVLIIIGIIVTATMLKIPDANKADRAYGA